jgi:hypothetical protein
MAKFIYLELSKAFLNLDYVTLVNKLSDDNLSVNIVDQKTSQFVEGNDAKNLLSWLQREEKERK